MKRFLAIGALTIAAAAISTPEAPAWVNWKLGVGLNMGWQAGGNNFLWGLFRNGQPPAPDFCGGFGGAMLPPGLPGPGPYPPQGPGPYPPQGPGAYAPPGPGAYPPPGPVSAPSSSAPANVADDSANGTPARTQSFQRYPWSAQTANYHYQYSYQYPYYPSYYNYGHSYYGYAR
jgi:hypothetical protein